MYRVLGAATVVQYSDVPATGESSILWKIPVVTGPQFGVLYSASIGGYGDSLVLSTPDWGDISVAFEPGLVGFKPKKYLPRVFGFEVEISFIRCS